MDKQRIFSNNLKVFPVVLFLVIMLLSFAGTTSFARSYGDEPVLWYFWGDGCEKCELASEWVDILGEKYPEITVKKTEVWKDRDGRELYLGMLQERDVSASWVPAIIFGDRVWHGLNLSVMDDISYTIENFLLSGDHGSGNGDGDGSKNDYIIHIRFLGNVNLSDKSVILSTILIALADGFNPCSLWVLTVLISMIITSRSRSKIALVGGVFILVTALVYGLFISGVFTVLSLVSSMTFIKLFAAFLAILFAVFHIKDFFAFGKGFSFSIPKKVKPWVLKTSHAIKSESSIGPKLLLTAVFAAGISLAEIPCTAGFPVIWSGLISSFDIKGFNFLALLLVYIFFYLLVEIIVILVSLTTLKMTRLQEKGGRFLKLFGGVIMLFMGIYLIFSI